MFSNKGLRSRVISFMNIHDIIAVWINSIAWSPNDFECLHCHWCIHSFCFQWNSSMHAVSPTHNLWQSKKCEFCISNPRLGHSLWLVCCSFTQSWWGKWGDDPKSTSMKCTVQIYVMWVLTRWSKVNSSVFITVVNMILTPYESLINTYVHTPLMRTVAAEAGGKTSPAHLLRFS